jgi:hypothetical protein
MVPSPTNFFPIPTPPVSQDDELISQQGFLERIEQQIERARVLDQSQQRLVERIEQQSGRVQPLGEAVTQRIERQSGRVQTRRIYPLLAAAAPSTEQSGRVRTRVGQTRIGQARIVQTRRVYPLLEAAAQKVKQQSERVQPLEEVTAEGQEIEAPGPKSPRSLAVEIEKQREKIKALEQAAVERRRLEEERLIRETFERKERRKARSVGSSNFSEPVRERRRALAVQQDEQRRREREALDESTIRACLRHKERLQTRSLILEEQHRQDRRDQDDAGQAYLRRRSIADARRAQQKSLTEGRIVAFDGVLPSFLDEEYQYMKQASTDFPERITSDIQMGCMKKYQRAISDASRRLPCGLCGGLFQEDEMMSISLPDDNLQYFLQRTRTAPDCCAVKDDMVSLCTACNSAIAKRAIPPLSAGNFVNCLFCQDYPEALKNLNTVEEAFIARAHVIGIFLKLTSGAKGGISYRGSRGHCVAVRQDPSDLLKILPAARLRDHTTITVSWDRGTPPSEENLARFCSVDKAKVVNALLWLCANNPGYKSVVVDYSVLDSWPDHHIPQEIREAFITLGSEPGSTDTPVEDDREGYATSLQDGLFENELDAEVEDAEPGSILSRSFFSDLHGRDLHSTPATLASLQAILQEQDPDRSALREDDAVDVQGDEEGVPNDNSRLPHISYKTTQHLPPMSAFTDPDYFTAAFPTLFPFGIGGHLGDANGDRPEEVSLKAFARYTMLHHSLL